MFEFLLLLVAIWAIRPVFDADWWNDPESF